MSTFAVVLVASMGFVFLARDRADEDNRRLAAVDSLTGGQPARGDRSAEPRCRPLIRTHEPMALMMVDIDHFKNVNDRYGHRRATRCCAAWWRCCASGCGHKTWWAATAAKNSWVLLPDTTAKGGYLLAQQLCEAVQAPGAGARRPAHSRDSEHWRIRRPTAARRPWDMLISAADRALYEARTGGATAWKWWRRCAAPIAGGQLGVETQPALF